MQTLVLKNRLAALGVATLLGAGVAAWAQPSPIAPTTPAPDLNLLVQHSATSMGADGVQRSMLFSERVYRRAGTVWVERVVPEHAHSKEEHAQGGKSHKHLDVAASARWITAPVNNQPPQVRLVSAHDKVVVDVAKTDFGNIGFDGSWPSAYHLIDPTLLQSMKVLRTHGDVVTYQRQDPQQRVTVQWNRRLQVPVSVESTGPGGSRTTRVKTVPAPAAMPWTQLGSYNKKDYADYLD